MDANIVLNESKILNKVENDRLGLFISTEWKRLINPYTPRDTGALEGITGATVELRPFEIEYRMPYAEIVYHNRRGVTFIRNGAGRNPYATDHWDHKAEQAGQKEKLIKAVNAALRAGRI